MCVIFVGDMWHLLQLSVTLEYILVSLELVRQLRWIPLNCIRLSQKSRCTIIQSNECIILVILIDNFVHLPMYSSLSLTRPDLCHREKLWLEKEMVVAHGAVVRQSLESKSKSKLRSDSYS